MARNELRDRQEADRRKDQIIRAGFELFSRYGIEPVSMSAVANKAGVGASTMYKYFQNKVNLTVAISGYIWSKVWMDALEQQGMGKLSQMSPRQLFELYADIIISLYRERPQVLRYSGNYKTYIRREKVPTVQLGDHLEPLQPIADLFLKSCENACSEHGLRADASAQEIFSFTALTMLTMAERYAQGIVWTECPQANHVNDLLRLKNMLSTWMKGE